MKSKIEKYVLIINIDLHYSTQRKNLFYYIYGAISCVAIKYKT
jgi:hypothetical protein